MSTIVINPMTRISGLMELQVVVENNQVVDAKAEGVMFRGFEQMLRGRQPLDAVYFTQRICGICSAAHSVASCLALEAAMGIVVQEQGRYLRDIAHICDILQNHLRHFYQFTVPDFVKLPNVSALFETADTDYRLPQQINDVIAQHYFESLSMSRAAHTMLAVLSGKAPHAHGIFIGGITPPATVDGILALRSRLDEIRRFVEEKMLPDAYQIAQYYGDYFYIGRTDEALLSYGCFYNYADLGTLYVNPSVLMDGEIRPLDPGAISEQTERAFYAEPPESYTPFQTIVAPDPAKADAYSWIKAARYMGRPFQVGPLARMWLAGEYQNGTSTMDRTLARVLEARKLVHILGTLLDNVIPGIPLQGVYSVPARAQGMGLVDTTRGALGHWLEIEEGVISLYQLITPSVWNVASAAQGRKGPLEQSLIGTHVADENAPVEVGRTVRSFDPCISCATHVYRPGKDAFIWNIMP